MSESPEELKQLAGDLSNALAATLPSRKRSLVDLIQQIGYLNDTEGAVPEEMIAEFRAEAQWTLLAKGEKIDNYAKLIHYFTMRAASAAAELKEFAASEVDRLKKRIERAEGDARRLGDAALYAISLQGRDAKGKLQPLEGVNYTLSAAGVVDSCEVTDESLVPLEFKNVTVSYTGPAANWALLGGPKVMFLRELLTAQHSIDKKKLLAALKEKCETCEGVGIYTVANLTSMSTEALQAGASVEGSTCAKCNGKGTRLIPGAKLLTNKLRLVIR